MFRNVGSLESRNVFPRQCGRSSDLLCLWFWQNGKKHVGIFCFDWQRKRILDRWIWIRMSGPATDTPVHSAIGYKTCDGATAQGATLGGGGQRHKDTTGGKSGALSFF